MGERKCAFEGCNALEFRTSGYCQRHGGAPIQIDVVEEDSKEVVSKIDLPRLVTFFLILYWPIPLIFLDMFVLNPLPEPGGSIAPTGFLDPCFFICSLVPVAIGLILIRRGSSDVQLESE